MSLSKLTPEQRAEEIVNGFKHGKTTTWTHLGTSKQMVHDTELIPLIAAAIKAAVAEEREACAKIAGKRFTGWNEAFLESNSPTHWTARCEAFHIMEAIKERD